MRILNNSSIEILVAINKWGNTGDTSYFPIYVKKFEDWDRSDTRGFIMSLQRENNDTHSYFIKFDSNITINDGSVSDNGSIIHPLN